MNADILQIMRDRYSCRKFTDEQLTDDELRFILEAGRIAPSACNNQPWRFIVLWGEEGLAKVDACCKCRYGAQVAILLCFDQSVSAKNSEVTPDYGWIDCGLALMQMVLVADSLGLGSCIVGAYEPKVAREILHLPDDLITYQFLMLGHEEAGPSHMHEDRHSLDEIVIEGGF